MVKSACGIEAVYMCFNGTGIWGGETMISSLQGHCVGSAANIGSMLHQLQWANAVVGLSGVKHVSSPVSRRYYSRTRSIPRIFG